MQQEELVTSNWPLLFQAVRRMVGPHGSMACPSSAGSNHMACCPCSSCTREASSGERRGCSPGMLRLQVLTGWDTYRHHFVLSGIMTWENLVASQADS